MGVVDTVMSEASTLLEDKCVGEGKEVLYSPVSLQDILDAFLLKLGSVTSII